MLAVYRFVYDNLYQHLLIDDPILDEFAARGEPLGKVWVPPLAYSNRPKLKVPDLWTVGPLQGFALSKELFSALPLLKHVGELLPLKCEVKEVFYFNVTNVVDCLDREKADFDREINAVDRFVFKPERFSGSLFRIPETAVVLAVEGLASPDQDFKAIVEERKLTGLDFDLVWSEVA